MVMLLIGGVCVEPALGASGADQRTHLQAVRFDSLADAQEAENQLKSGMTYDEMARRFAPEGLRERSGYLGPVSQDALLPTIRQALLKLRPGDASGILAVEGGFVVVRVVRPDQVREYEVASPSAQMHLDRGLLLGEMGDADGEIDAYRKALDLEPPTKEGWVNLGEALRRKAMRVLERKTGSAPPPKDGSLDLATELLDEAIDAFKMAISLDRELWEAHYNLGLAYAAEGLLDLTVLEFREALRFQPDMGALHRSMALVLLLQGDREQARVHAQRAKDLGVDVDDVNRRIEGESKKSKPPPKPKSR
jgi:tetratricopeptide (TPR) repeat protein